MHKNRPQLAGGFFCSGSTLGDEAGKIRQRGERRTEWRDQRDRLSGEIGQMRLCAFHTEYRRIRRLVRGDVLACGFTDRRTVAFDIEDVVANLERQADAM